MQTCVYSVQVRAVMRLCCCSLFSQIGEDFHSSVPMVQWDGHAGSAELTRQQAQSKVTVQEQIEHIQRMQGLL